MKPMLSCEDAHRLIARVADADEVEQRQALDAHLESCALCRAALVEQRDVAAILRSRPSQSPSPGFASRLAWRLDEASGWLGIVDARVWTFRLAPIAAVLALVAILASGSSTTQRSTQTLEEWARSSLDPKSGASMLWQPDANAESLLEVMATGKTSSTGGAADVR
jgi:anti-sigma factor RsiW